FRQAHRQRARRGRIPRPPVYGSRRTGAGMTESFPLAAFQRIRFISAIGISSGREKSICADAPDSGALAPLVAVSETPGGTTLKGRRFGVEENAADIGVAAASNWLIGGTPTRSSIVRSTETPE